MNRIAGAGHPEAPSLRADCSRCFGLCCVAPAFTRSADFAIDKPAGRPCPNLAENSSCTIHDELRPRGFAGCTVYDCFGAGQRISQLSFGGRDWRTPPAGTAGPAYRQSMFEAFAVLRQLHELLWYLGAALELASSAGLPADLHAELTTCRADTERLAGSPAKQLPALGLDAHRARANALLLRASELARATAAGPDHRGADLTGARLAGADLRGASLRGARLIGADLRGARLGLADVTGADLRGADLRAAELSTTLFLLQSQLDSAGGDERTRLPDSYRRPAHWAG